MVSIEQANSLEVIERLEEAWCRLRDTSELKTISHGQYIDALQSRGPAILPLVFVVREHDEIIAILPFTEFDSPKKFVFGEIRLFSIRHRVLHSSGSIIGSLDYAQAQKVIDTMAEIRHCDAINLYEVPAAEALYRAVQARSSVLKTSSAAHDLYPHWVVDFPDSFAAYMSSFKSKTRNTLKRKLKHFESKFETKLEKITDAGDVGRFLQIGEGISRQTYQWQLGTRLVNDERCRRSMTIAARQNELCCYLLHADGAAIAFTWGYLANNVFHYETPGFLRDYSRYSPGIVILLKVFEDLIENTPCRRFDFGVGGDYSGYKAQFGNNHYDAAVLEFFPAKTLKSRLLYRLDRLFWRAKQLARRMISPTTKSRIKKLMRKFGILK